MTRGRTCSQLRPWLVTITVKLNRLLVVRPFAQVVSTSKLRKDTSTMFSTERQYGFSTQILPVSQESLQLSSLRSDDVCMLEDWELSFDEDSASVQNLRKAANELLHSDVPVAFPTETVYGLGADATRSSAVKGIYEAKQRPSDNPLIVHIHSLRQLRSLLNPAYSPQPADGNRVEREDQRHISATIEPDPIPDIYYPLIKRFWPGPLTLLLANPTPSSLAREVTAGLPTFGARMPGNPLALALLKLAGVPLAAPSANASTRPSPTTAEHVKYDLDGRIKIILDGGPCGVGVESTVVDGLTVPPVILRPGGISLEELQSCRGWEDVKIGYKDASEIGAQPKAPGMKYRHYSPRASVILYEVGSEIPSSAAFVSMLQGRRRLGIIRTRTWPAFCAVQNASSDKVEKIAGEPPSFTRNSHDMDGASHSEVGPQNNDHEPSCLRTILEPEKLPITIWEMSLGHSALDIARNLFSALRDLDQHDVDIIVVEGINGDTGDVAAAVMNRLRKAAGTTMSS